MNSKVGLILGVFWICAALVIAVMFVRACGEFGFELSLPFFVGAVGYSAIGVFWLYWARAHKSTAPHEAKEERHQ